MTQTYTGTVPLRRLRAGVCPECGEPTHLHDGWGGPHGCSLTDNGVAARIYRQQQIDDAEQALDDDAEGYRERSRDEEF